MGEYRDLSTACSVRSNGGDLIVPGQSFSPLELRPKGPTSKVVHYDRNEGRARFNWQDRKRHDLKGQPKACGQCELSHVCEGVWKGYLDIWGDRAFTPVSVADTALGALLQSS